MKLQKASKDDDDDDDDGDDDGVTSSQAGRLKTHQRGVAGRAGCHLHGYTCWQRHLLKNFAGEK